MAGFLTSTKAGIVVMAVLAVLSMLGALIPQGGTHEAYVEVFGSLRGNAIWYTGLDNVYRSYYYSGLLVLLCIMVFACSLKRLPARIRQASRREFIADGARIGRMPCKADLVLDVDGQEAALHAVDICRKRLYRTHMEKRDGVYLVFASRAGFARYGSFLLHVSFIFLLAGGIAFTRFGRRSYEDVPVGGEFAMPGPGDAAVMVEDFEVVYDDGERKGHKSQPSA
jgi:cytochrome c biogenesis protein